MPKGVVYSMSDFTDFFLQLYPTLLGLPPIDGIGEVASRAVELRITTTVNGELRQDDTTANLIFDVATLVSYLSRVTTSVTGDVIFTGTPDGVRRW